MQEQAHPQNQQDALFSHPQPIKDANECKAAERQQAGDVHCWKGTTYACTVKSDVGSNVRRRGSSAELRAARLGLTMGSFGFHSAAIRTQQHASHEP